MLTDEQKAKYDAAVRLITKGADRIYFDKENQIVGSGMVYVKLADVITSINLMHDVLKQVEDIKTLEMKDKVIVLKGEFNRSQLEAFRKSFKSAGVLGIMALEDEMEISEFGLDKAIEYLKEIKEKKQNGKE